LEYFVQSNFGSYNFNFISEIKILIDQIYSEKSYYQYTENLLSDLESCIGEANASIANTESLFYLGEKYGQIGKYKKAVALLMQGVELSPDIQGFEYYASLIKQYSKHY
jgi:tetratricopeptide (TPR) repeat protein